MANTLHPLYYNVANNESVVIKGTTRDDVLYGSLGHTVFYGGLGNDIYHSKNAGDTIVEYGYEGNDTVYADTDFTLPTHVENLTLTGYGNHYGFGNNSNNTLIGNNGNNRLSGGRGSDTLHGMDGNDLLMGGDDRDTLDGGSGADSMSGGYGDDIYYVDNVNDTVTEGWFEGTDTIYSSVSYTAPTNVENLTLTGYGNHYGFGNNSNNTLTEGWFEGTDTIYSSVSYTAPTNVENLTLTGSNNIFGIGNYGNNTLTGNSGHNRLSGEDGNDTLYGMSGDDTLSGGNGYDYLNGGDGDDYIAGGLGSDTIVTGAGRDTVAFTASDIRDGSTDRLTDFNPYMDKLDLSAMRSLLSGNNAKLSWSEMFVSNPSYYDADRSYLVFDSAQQTLAYRAAGASSNTVFAKFDSDQAVWLNASNIIG